MYSLRTNGTRAQTLKVVLRRPPNPNAGVSRATWSPSGRQIAIVESWVTVSCGARDPGGAHHLDSDCGEDDHNEIYVVTASGGSPRRLTTDGKSEGPIWSPDGRSICYQDDNHPGIWIVPAHGGRRRVIGANLRMMVIGDWQSR